jgi:hypothetical protein
VAQQPGPLDYVRFLDHCVKRVFLQRVGGGYIFVHRLLMEYFASSYEQPPAGTEAISIAPRSTLTPG